jgi:predicted dehydrogenase
LKRAQAIKNSKKGKLKNIFDPDKNNLEKAEKILETKSSNLQAILTDKNIHAVCICAPNKFHKKIIIDSLKSGKYVFCEKPIAANLSEAEEIYEITKKYPNKLQIGSNHRYFESVKFAKKLIAKNEIGEVLSFSGRIGHNGERIKNSWFWKKEMSGGGTLIDNGCHLLDLSRFFLGNFEKGSGIISNIYWKNIDVEDTAFGNFKTKDGKVASIFCSWRLLSGYFFFELNGTEGYINVDGRFDTHGGDKVFWMDREKKINSKDFSKIKPNSYVDEINNFIENLENGRDCSPSAKDGLEVMRMVNLIYSNN